MWDKHAEHGGKHPLYGATPLPPEGGNLLHSWLWADSFYFLLHLLFHCIHFILTLHFTHIFPFDFILIYLRFQSSTLPVALVWLFCMIDKGRFCFPVLLVLFPDSCWVLFSLETSHRPDTHLWRQLEWFYSAHRYIRYFWKIFLPCFRNDFCTALLLFVLQ